MKRVIPFLVLTVALTAVNLVRADDLREALVVRAGDQKLTIYEFDKLTDKVQTYEVPFDAKIYSIRDERAIDLTDLKKDSLVRVTTQLRGDKTWVTNVDVLEDIVSNLHEGLVVAGAGEQLTITDVPGKRRYTHAVPADARIIGRDGKDLKLEQLPRGAKVQILMARRGDKVKAVRIEVRDDQNRGPGPETNR